MKALIQKTIALLKMQVKNNLDVINKNQSRIKEILQEPASTDRSLNFEKHYEINKSLIAENNDLINVQLTLINFLEKYKTSSFLKDKQPLLNIKAVNKDELFNLTVKGKISYGLTHPCYENEEFFQKLFAYFQKNEEYEKCQELLNLKKK